MIARIIVDINIPSLDKLFDYIIPDDELNNLEIGMRVIVPFGAQKRLGYVIDIIDESPKATRSILEVLDIYPSLTNESFKYINYLNDNNNATLIELIETVLPKEIFLSYYQEIHIANTESISKDLLDNLSLTTGTRYTKKLKEYQSEIKRLVNNKGLKIVNIYEQKGKVKYKNVLSFNSNHNYARIDNYLDIVEILKRNNYPTRQELVDEGFSLSSINTLIKNEVIRVEKVETTRYANFIKTNKIEEHLLNEEQIRAYISIKKQFNHNETFLLKGITGSGKTEVYMHLMRDIINAGQNILYLVPEISLVAPLVQQLKSRFTETIVHYNSSLSVGERFDSYRAINNNEARIIVGTRSSIFLPIKDLGIIIVDEEHDSSYNQDGFKVQYNLIDLLKIKQGYHNIPVVLGSATPKVTTMYYALNNIYKLLELTKRATNQPLPVVSFIDMKRELSNGNTSIFSNKLNEEILNRLNKKEQIILLYNRKGYSSFTLCRTCNYIPKCNNCDISLTYYKDTNDLRCSYCGYKESNLTICPTCNNETIRPIGLGIDQVVELTKKAYPSARIIKMDSNNTKTKGSHEKIWLDFKDNEYDILIGTKMVSKGLDFPNVTLVGILMADLELKSPTYLATEEAYALLTQMVGRSGRHIKGDSIIQGYDIENYALKSVLTNYEDFYKEAIYHRQITKYEPFYKVSQILIQNKSYLSSYQDAVRIKNELSKTLEIVLGPSEPVIKYIKGYYRFIITIKNRDINPKIVMNIIKNNITTSTFDYYINPTLI